ncbi:MAG: leucyl aminopeptidase [Ignavibacteriales bacterium]|nr:MAG: leucyl aminopeptidase [Ignavibacteriales bacterium]
MFRFKIIAADKKISYKPFSVSLKFLIDEKKLGDSLKNIERVFNVKVSALQRKSFLAKEGDEIRISKYDGKPDEVFISKVTLDDKFNPDYFRNHLAGFLPRLNKEEIRYLHIFIPKFEAFKQYFDDEEYFYQTFIEGIYYGNYSFDSYKSEKKDLKDLEISFYADNSKKLKNALKNAETVMQGVNFARDLENEPALKLTPDSFAQKLKSDIGKLGVKVKVFDEKEIIKRKMGGLLAVGMGSQNPPRFIVMEYKGSSRSKKKKISLVGKGVTFDTGGISIKPAQNMGWMKADMSGAAVVAGTILAAAKANLPLDIIGVIPAAENMLSGNAMRPGDIVKSASGKTIEIDNTDAEGRIILADALHYASKEKPDIIVDLATLTGACVVALGEFVAGLFTKDQKLSDTLFNAGLKTYDRVWPLPMWDDFHKQNKSDVADVKNLGGRWGGAITAAKFLENFVDSKIPWVHLDIAGPSILNDSSNYSKKYMTGFGVRLLFEFLQGSIKKK